MTLKMCAPCLFGLEGPLANELKHMDVTDVQGQTGRVRFTGDENAVARVNIRSRFAERVLVELGSFRALTFDDLFEGTKALPWESFIPKNGSFPVKGYSLDSALHSVPDCQKIIKKAVAARLGKRYGVTWLPEDGALYQIQFEIMKDTAVLYLDTTGTGLHKRGYRPAQVAAPLRETLAAALVDIAGYRGRGDFCDPFCGSGTIAIEAALAAKGRAPGLKRRFTAQSWECFNKKIWDDERSAAAAREYDGDYHIFASDVDPHAIELARANASRAGVDKYIKFSVADAAKFSRSTERGVIVTNPPYGKRLLDEAEARKICAAFGSAVRRTSGWSVYILTADEELDKSFGRRADKVRRMYNGTIRCGYYMYK